MRRNVIAIILMLILIFGMNAAACVYVNKENNVLKNKFFIVSGMSYYAVENGGEANLNFILVDSKEEINEMKEQRCKGILCNAEDQEEMELESITFRLISEYSSYSVYSVIARVDSMQMEKNIEKFQSLKVCKETGEVLFNLSVGNVILEKIERIESCSQVEIGCFLNGGKADKYSLCIDNNADSLMKIDGICFRIKESVIDGVWDNNIVYAGEKEAELTYSFDNGEPLNYIQPVIYYTLDGKQYGEIAKAPTSYIGDLNKQDIIRYIEENLE